MAVPVIAVTFIGSIISAIVQFFVSKVGSVLVGLGLSMIFVTGLEVIAGYIISDIQSIVSTLGSGSGISSGGSVSWASLMLQFAAYAGFFDGLNIVIGAYMTYFPIVQMKVLFGRYK